MKENVSRFQFKDMLDIVHADEECFYLMEVNRSYILLPEELPPHRQTKSKCFISKEIFLSAVARPRRDHAKAAVV